MDEKTKIQCDLIEPETVAPETGVVGNDSTPGTDDGLCNTETDRWDNPALCGYPPYGNGGSTVEPPGYQQEDSYSEQEPTEAPGTDFMDEKCSDPGFYDVAPADLVQQYC
ncbi:hypothetical protein GIY23_07190 [Allosaccharopolyspora coralli]|uniref:Uncharacterized protein n=1 Tax=Allosaccharopolyspora coralli TaxID=2665642 RepID=A0A5Q3Q668_9PSEU|nr:hypothetical protein [Allosaccharopolyspora coralli]QGK69340.1 hypothetical protein GIY23_07190 [Allosaccharopolyspora coralli]